MKINVAVLCGGKSNEREISLDTGESIIQSLDKEKYDIVKIIIPKGNDNSWINSLIINRIDIAVIALHGGVGEDGSIQGLLNCLDIPYIGSDVLGSAIGMDKYLSKELLKANDITVPKGALISPKNVESLKDYSYPLIVKPNSDGSSYGVCIVHDKAELQKVLDELHKKEPYVLVEEYIDGHEVTCGVIELNGKLGALDVLDISSSHEFYDYDAKYELDDTKIETSTLPDNIQEEIKSTAKKAFKILRSKDYIRVDMIVKDSIIYVLEINTLPGMTSHSLLPRALKNKNIELSTFLDLMIDEELKKREK